jgi:hypothetical protein
MAEIERELEILSLSRVSCNLQVGHLILMERAIRTDLTNQDNSAPAAEELPSEFETLRENVNKHAIPPSRVDCTEHTTEYCKVMTDIVKHERDASEATIRERTDSMDPVSIKWRKDGQLIAIGTVEISASQVKYFRHQQYVNLRFSRKTVANLGVWPANIVDLEFINVTVTKVD